MYLSTYFSKRVMGCGGDRDKRDLVAAIECGPLCGVTGLRGCWLRRKVQFYQLCDGCSPGGYYANFGMANQHLDHFSFPRGRQKWLANRSAMLAEK